MGRTMMQNRAVPDESIGHLPEKRRHFVLCFRVRFKVMVRTRVRVRVRVSGNTLKNVFV